MGRPSLVLGFPRWIPFPTLPVPEPQRISNATAQLTQPSVATVVRSPNSSVDPSRDPPLLLSHQKRPTRSLSHRHTEARELPMKCNQQQCLVSALMLILSGACLISSVARQPDDIRARRLILLDEEGREVGWLTGQSGNSALILRSTDGSREVFLGTALLDSSRELLDSIGTSDEIARNSGGLLMRNDPAEGAATTISLAAGAGSLLQLSEVGGGIVLMHALDSGATLRLARENEDLEAPFATLDAGVSLEGSALSLFFGDEVDIDYKAGMFAHRPGATVYVADEAADDEETIDEVPGFLSTGELSCSGGAGVILLREHGQVRSKLPPE